MKSNKTVGCPRCHSGKVVKNGKKKTGVQNILCKSCGLQFQEEYLYWGAGHRNKGLLKRMLLRGSGVRDCAVVLGISVNCVPRSILSMGKASVVRPKKAAYHIIQIDEQWPYVGNKQKKVWLLYAICEQSGEILAASWGKRDKRNIKELLKKLQGLEINFYCTDQWKAFAEVLPKEKHIIGKKHTKKIEGINTWFRTRLRRLARRTVCFSKKLLYHYSIMKTAIYERNIRTSYI
ncbi:MAG: IS1 family transposase [Mucilaginibacter sp.]|uniref:IS1 family transposase n=1 Tax=Mucilaginibacter sp. TaxID=1882438 RepID=UPI0034E5E673